MVLHGIVLLALARGLYLARHLPTLFYQDSRGEREFLPGLLKSFPFLQCSANHIVTAKALEKVKVYSVRIVILAAMHIMPTTFTYQSIPTS